MYFKLRHRMRSKQAISRILFSEAITRRRNDDHSSRMPIARHLKRPTQGLGRAARCIPLFGLAPGGVYPASPVTRRTGALLPHHFTLTLPKQGGILSVALAFALPRLHVMEHPALWCSDFPPVPHKRNRRSSGLLRPQYSISFKFSFQLSLFVNPHQSSKQHAFSLKCKVASFKFMLYPIQPWDR
jgi:hypothetical protein